MDYDPVVLSVQETAIIATAFEEIEEVLTTVSPEELFIYEEFIVEEFVPFEEPQIFTEMFSEILVEEVAIEEINTGYLDLNKPWMNQRKFVDKWIGIRLIYNNIENNLLNLYSTEVGSRKYYR